MGDCFSAGNGRAYLLTSVPERASALLLMAGLALVLRRAAARTSGTTR